MYHYTFIENCIKSFYDRLYRKTKNERFLNYRKGLWDKYMKKYGPEALSIIHETSKKYQIHYWLTWGSMLAYYREHGFIKGDNDIDLGVIGGDLKVGFIQELQNKGFEFCSPIVDINHHGYHFVFYYKNVKIDFYSFYIQKDKKTIEGYAPLAIDGSWTKSSHINKYINRRTILPYTGIMEVDYVGAKTYVPNNIKEMLSIIYGEDFMTPKPGYKGGENKNQFKEYDGTHYASMVSNDVFLELIQSDTFKL